jgi:hypothetical protein
MRPQRPEIGVTFTDSGPRTQRQAFVELPVARRVVFARDPSRRARFAIPSHEPLDLAYRQARTIGGTPGLQSHAHHCLDQLGGLTTISRKFC